ncbi:MAG: hypothetical protein Q8R33_09165 [Burkholderiales bacterium]|nr:hypothetical protein [Burkholderiales bacterium]
MSIDRRKIIGLFAATAATTLAGCGGGGGDDGPYLQRVWVMNVNPEFPSADVSVGSTLVAAGLPFPGLTSPLDFESGFYAVRVRRPASSVFFDFDPVRIDAASSLPSLFVFYRHFASARLVPAPRGIENYFDSTVNLDYDLFDGDGTGNSFVQTQLLPFEGGGRQTSNSSTCRLRLYAENSPTLIYDSGVQPRPDSILIHPRFPAASARSGEVAVTAVNYGFVNAGAVVWPNLLDLAVSLPAVSGTPDPRVRGVRGI